MHACEWVVGYGRFSTDSVIFFHEDGQFLEVCLDKFCHNITFLVALFRNFAANAVKSACAFRKQTGWNQKFEIG